MFEQSLSPLPKLKNVFFEKIKKTNLLTTPTNVAEKSGESDSNRNIPTVMRSIEKLNRNSFTIWNISIILKHHHFPGDVCQKSTHPPKVLRQEINKLAETASPDLLWPIWEGALAPSKGNGMGTFACAVGCYNKTIGIE